MFVINSSPPLRSILRIVCSTAYWCYVCPSSISFVGPYISMRLGYLIHCFALSVCLVAIFCECQIDINSFLHRTYITFYYFLFFYINYTVERTVTLLDLQFTSMRSCRAANQPSECCYLHTAWFDVPPNWSSHPCLNCRLCRTLLFKTSLLRLPL